jgi:hypothetical protein
MLSYGPAIVMFQKSSSHKAREAKFARSEKDTTNKMNCLLEKRTTKQSIGRSL